MARRKIQFEGLLQQNVLGTFTVIRGFADLRDLAEVSVAMPYEGGGLVNGQGYQRMVSPKPCRRHQTFSTEGQVQVLSGNNP